jgi:hypothetical protein
MRLLDRQHSAKSSHSMRTMGKNESFMDNNSKYSLQVIPELPTGLKIYFDDKMITAVMESDKPKDLVTELIVQPLFPKTRRPSTSNARKFSTTSSTSK